MCNINELKEKIEAMTKHHQIEILRICKSHKDSSVNENNNGSFINLSEQSEELINQIKNYVDYVNMQQEHLDEIENEKNRIQTTFFKCIKD